MLLHHLKLIILFISFYIIWLINRTNTWLITKKNNRQIHTKGSHKLEELMEETLFLTANIADMLISKTKAEN